MKNNLIKKCIFLAVLAIVILFVVIIMLRYNVKGEQEMPFSLKKILLVSTVSGDSVDDAENIWNINVSEVNDVYIFIDRKDNIDQTIKEIKFSNFNIDEAPKKGELKLLRPTGELSNLYLQSTGNYLDKDITYLGGAIDDMKALEIANTGGMVGFRFSLDNLGTYKSNENDEINYDGSLLTNIGVNLDDIKFKTSFDLTIKTSNDVSYVGNVSLDMPVNTVITEKESSMEITDFSNVIFKRNT